MKIPTTEQWHTALSAELTHRPELAPCLPAIVEAADRLTRTVSRDGQILLAGNGGSAADAEHWAGELLKGFYHPRPLAAEHRAGLSSDIADRLQNGIRALPLTSFPAARTAMLNDQGADIDFGQLVWALGRPGDVFVAISTSGNARNLAVAAEIAHAKGLKVIALTGESGGGIRPLADIWLPVPSQRTHLIQEFHLSVYHAISICLENVVFGQK